MGDFVLHVHVDVLCCYADEKQLLEFRQQEVDSLQHKVMSLRAELKTEMTHARQLNEAHVRQFLFVVVVAKQVSN